ncbi:YqjF family protein [Halobacterium zhouii]|uniref:YqjF family protein n=1 Tax=Halobacterium zhouii TaxID=2902624 RepID=UPI001E575337|nr:DUF2071 domain-containing protein [Halobacterium zhouii]
MVLPVAFGWRHLLFANWPVDADELDAHVPDAFAVDEYDGTGWLSIVPLVNVDTRPRGLPGWAGVTLRELNVRTYVTCDGEPGVYFFSLDAQGLASVLGARLTHFLPYYYARIRFRRDGGRARGDGGRVRVSSRRRHPGDRPARFTASYAPTGDAFEAEPGSLAEFLTERRRLFTQSPNGTVRHTNVEHDQWTLYDAKTSITENTVFEATRFESPDAEPVCYYSPGVDVVTTRSKRWR